MADGRDGDAGGAGTAGPRVEVFESERMADPAVPDDVIHGKRFTNPVTGEPASIEDILVGSGLLRPREGKPGG